MVAYFLYDDDGDTCRRSMSPPCCVQREQRSLCAHIGFILLLITMAISCLCWEIVQEESFGKTLPMRFILCDISIENMEPDEFCHV